MVILFAGILAGCASAGTNRLSEIHKELAPLVQHETEESMARRWGAPSARERFGATSSWTYYFEPGSRSKKLAEGSVTNRPYEKIVLQFRYTYLMEYSVVVRQ
jgi:hypothetical protein